MPASAVRPGAAPGWQAAAAGLLFLFTAATCLQLALVANVSLLPKVRARVRFPGFKVRGVEAAAGLLFLLTGGGLPVARARRGRLAPAQGARMRMACVHEAWHPGVHRAAAWGTVGRAPTAIEHHAACDTNEPHVQSKLSLCV